MTLAGALTCALALGACGSGSDEGDGETATTAGGGVSSTAAPTTPTTGGADPGAFPDEPQLLLRFGKPADGWPRRVARGEARGGYDAKGYRLDVPAGAPALRVAAERRIEPATRGVLLETTVRLPASGGAGLFCRGSGSRASGYALTVQRRGRWTIERFEDGRASVVESGPLARQAAGGTLLRFVCGAAREGEPLTLGRQIGATSLTFVTDPKALAPGDVGSVGIVARPIGGSATTPSFDYFSATLAE